MGSIARTTQVRSAGNYLDGVNNYFDARQGVSNLEKVIGRLPDNNKYDYTGQQARTFGDLTETLLERAPRVVKMQVTGLLEKSYISPFTTRILPIRQLGEMESLNVTWTEMNFNGAQMDQVEMLGAGRYFTHNKTRRGARAVRRGAAVKIESTFFMTQEGRDEWALQIEQLATAIQETNEYDIMLTLLQVPMDQEIHAQDMNGPYNHMFYGAKPDMTFEERLVLFRDMFSIVNKTPDSRGFNGMVTNLKTIMERNGTKPDTIIVPPYMVGTFYYSNDDLWQHQSAGPAVAANREAAYDTGGGGPIRTQNIQGLRIIDTHIYRPVAGSRNSANDLLTVPTQIGEFYAMSIKQVYRDTKSFEGYRSSNRDIKIFDEKQSRFVPVYFLDALENSFRWNKDAKGESQELHRDRHTPDTNMASLNDVFVNNGNLVSKWGEVTGKNLPDEAITRVVNSVKGNMFTDDEWVTFTAAAAAAAAANGGGDYPEDLKTHIAKLKSVFGSTGVGGDDKLLKAISGNFTEGGIGNKLGLDVEFVADRSAIFEMAANSASRVIAAVFLLSDITFPRLKKLHEANVFLPIDILLCRPWMTYYVSSVIVLKAGVETGMTIIGRQDFQMSSNTQTRELEASMVYYGKAIVTNSRNVLVAPNVYIQKYVRGNGTEWVTDGQLGEITNKSGMCESENSLVSMVLPYGSKVHRRSWIDYRGENPNTGAEKYHASGDFYKYVFLTNESDVFNPQETFVDYEDQSLQSNTICWSGHYNYGDNFSEESLCQGHLGPNTYDQVNNSRKEGMYEPIRPLQFKIRT
jgi:hypothetical protein